MRKLDLMEILFIQGILLQERDSVLIERKSKKKSQYVEMIDKIIKKLD